MVGIFSLGLTSSTRATRFVHLDVAKRLVGHDSTDFIELRVDDMFAAGEIADDIIRRGSATSTCRRTGPT